MHLYRRRALLFVTSACLQIGGTARAENSLPEDIAAALRAASDKLVTVSIEWTSQQQPAADIATLKGLQPGFGSPAMWALQTFRYDFDRGRYLAFARADAGIATKDGIYTGELEETEFQYSFNGSVIETGRTKTVLSRFRLDKLFSESPDARIMITNFWDSAGWRVPDLVADHVWFRDSHLSTIQSLPEYLLRHGFVVGDIVHDATVDTFSCVRLTLADKSRIYRIWLDPGLAFAIRRWEIAGSDDRLLHACRLSSFSLLTEGVWLPHECEVTYFDYGGVHLADNTHALISRSLVLTKVDLNKTLSDDSFRLSYPAGTQVYDEVHPQAQNSPDGAVTYQVPATASELDSAVNHALDEQGKSRAIDDSRPVNWLVVANVTAIFFAIAAAIFYKMRKGRGK